MSDSAPGWMLDRLRANLTAAGIPFVESDLAALVERGLLRMALRFETELADVSFSQLPDYLDVPGSVADPSLGAGVATPAPWPVAVDEGGDDPLRLSLLAVAERLRTGALSPVELAERSLARIRERQPRLNAISESNESRALLAAQRAREEIASGRWRGPLHGVPVAIKDLFQVRGLHTHAGSAVLPSSVDGGDSAVVERLETAGAVVIAKTHMAELAYSPGSANPHYGPTRNPWNEERNAGGSSSGSAVAVADGCAFAALGTDTGGSIRIPAAFCGIVGLKPTFGRVSLYGAVPLSWSLDHAGPLTRTVADAWTMLLVLAGHDARDPRTMRAPEGRWRPDRDLEAGVAGLRIGVPENPDEVDPPVAPETLAAWLQGLAALERAGATVVPLEMRELPSLPLAAAAIQQVESSAVHHRTLRNDSGNLGEFARLRLLAGFAYSPIALARGQQARAWLRRGCTAWFEHADLVSTPTMPAAAPALDAVPPTSRTIPFNVLGWPAVSVPVGLDPAGLPLAMQLVGPPWQEARVLRAARVVEQAVGTLSAPRGGG